MATLQHLGDIKEHYQGLEAFNLALKDLETSEVGLQDHLAFPLIIDKLDFWMQAIIFLDLIVLDFRVAIKVAKEKLSFPSRLH